MPTAGCATRCATCSAISPASAEAERLPHARCRSSSAGCCIGWPSSTGWCARPTTAFDFPRLYAALHNFCATDLSAFYFDVRKDALYCDPPDAIRRRAARTVLDQLFDCLTAWLAPVLVFTAEEAWLARHPGDRRQRPSAPVPERPGGLARSGARRPLGADPPGAARGHRRARGRAPREAHRLEPGGGAAGVRRRAPMPSCWPGSISPSSRS